MKELETAAIPKSLQCGDHCPESNVYSCESQDLVALSSFWKREPTLLVFLRHFG